MSFDDKVKELLKKYDHIACDEWRMICFAMFIEYQQEIDLKEMYRKAYAEKT